MKHPEELLAPFVDGTASLEERAAVEAHMAFCQRCVEEIGLAMQARAALAQLPEVEAAPIDLRALNLAADGREPAGASPDVAGAPVAGPNQSDLGMDGAAPGAGSGWLPPVTINPAEPTPTQGAVESAPHPSTGPGRPGAGGGRWRRRTSPGGRPVSLGHDRLPVRAIQAGLAVAAVALGLFVVVQLGGGSPTSSPGRAAGANGGAVPSPGQAPVEVPENAQAYTVSSLVTLADALAREARTNALTSGGERQSPSPTFGAGTQSGTTTEVAVSCMQAATGIAPGTPLYYLQGARYEGTPVYVGAFVTGTRKKPSLVVVAVSIDGCQALNVIHEKL